jgi:hypothetical protein
MPKQNQSIEVAGSRNVEVAKEIESVLIGGDLSKLTPQQCVEYYMATCKSLGLNPLTSPFQYLILNGKKVLYATKNCTEQLRKINGISITDMTESLHEGVFIVKVKGQDKTGRTDASSGAVAVAGLRGDPLANAMMKAETKGKRRFTLSISGLGMLDESEIDSIPGATVQPINVQGLPAEPKKEEKVATEAPKEAEPTKTAPEQTKATKTTPKPAPAAQTKANDPARFPKSETKAATAPAAPKPNGAPAQQAPVAPAQPQSVPIGTSAPKSAGERTMKITALAPKIGTSTTNMYEFILRSLGCKTISELKDKMDAKQIKGTQIDGVLSSLEGVLGKFEVKAVRTFICNEADIDANLAKSFTDLYIESQKA